MYIIAAYPAAAAKVLEEAGEPLSCKAIVERAFGAGYWQSDGKTPAATIYTVVTMLPKAPWSSIG